MSAVHSEDVVAGPVQEVSVVGCGDDRAIERVDRLLHRVPRKQVEMVGGLVQDQEVVGRKHELEDRESSALPAAQLLHLAKDGIALESVAAEDALGLVVQHLGIDALQLLHQVVPGFK